ncbi:MAG: hypothetical protein RIR04_515 [Pseudomonadota bacterium]|jgi:hypothetical protein
MNNRPNENPSPRQACQVLPIDAFFVTQGVNLGEAISGPDDVYLGDSYRLDPRSLPLHLVVAYSGAQEKHVARGSEVGVEGEKLSFDARYSLMSADGEKVELLLISVESGDGFVLPLSPIATGKEYNLVEIELDPEHNQLGDLLCVSFARGTSITLATGVQRNIEALVVGDVILTRDHGGQPLRWIGRATLRAVGAFAPVVFPSRLLGNAGDLIVSQHHRMFIYQRKRKAGISTSELLVQARHFVDNKKVFIREGGFVDYFSLVFDRHEIIYAQGVPVESLMVNDASVNNLPAELSQDVKARFPGLSQNQHFGTEAGRQFLEEIGTDALFKSHRA